MKNGFWEFLRLKHLFWEFIKTLPKIFKTFMEANFKYIQKT